MGRHMPSASGNFFKDVSRVLGWLWKKKNARKKSHESKVMRRLRQEWNK